MTITLIRQIMPIEYCLAIAVHYENMSVQIYWKFYHQQMEIFR